ncbi:MAG: hypothetical protein VCA38_08810 [Roseibacillus sp.]
MKKLPLTLAGVLFAILPLHAETVFSTLTITPGGGFNSIELEIEPPVLPSDSDATDLDGTLDVKLEINPDTNQVSEMTIIGGDATGSAIHLSGSAFLIGNYDFTSSELGAKLNTLVPPGIVDPLTGEFDAAAHELTVNDGVLTGSIEVPLLGIDDEVAFDFSAAPFGGTGSGTGTVTLTHTGDTPISKDYDIVVLLPISIVNEVDAGGVTIPISADGMIKAVGIASVPIAPADPFVTWTEDNGIAGASFDGDENGDGVANGLQWALGLDASTAPFSALLQPVGDTGATVDFTVTLPAGGSAAEISVLVSDDPETNPFALLTSGSVSTGNPIPAGTTGTVTISLPKNARGFVQLSVSAPGN